MSTPRYASPAPPDLDGDGPRRPVVVIGAGPVGLTCALDLATRGVPVLVLDDDDTVATGSRAICWAKRTLEIWDRLGVGSRMVDKGVTWNTGRVFHGARELYRFDLLPEGGHRRPAFVNLQQYYVEEFLIDRAGDFPDLIALRWKSAVTGLVQTGDGVRLTVDCPHGTYGINAAWVIAADGARSPTRTRMGLPFPGQRFEERFLIADVTMEAGFPTERLFWFEPTFHSGQSALLHRQPDGVFRLDFQLGPDADPELERRPDRVMRRVRAVVGEETPVSLAWCSVYSFRCARLARFVHGRVIFAGDSAHVVSPFGARGGNGGVQDADNLCWKLALVLAGRAPEALLATYDEERGHAADENIRQSSRTTAFMTPQSGPERGLRDAVLALAAEAPFARALLNAGRLSRPCSLAGLSLQTPDTAPFAAGPEPGTACPDAPVTDADGRPAWLLDRLGGPFTLLVFAGETAPDLTSLAGLGIGGDLRVVVVAPSPLGVPGAEILHDPHGLAAARYGAAPGTAYLIRPDAHVAARLPAPDQAAIARALARATGRPDPAIREAA
ncbi:FAD-dependent oxidoreductase [Methylobacterium platani]|uniref:FAD-dependent oxidoreductase n=2 Tax=Methylobacterium platani TaxID=427683 RepID=A0A179S209_9HYPH|nr:FAD-dependent oxidoreductase [Methylobacterium platani]KMO21731.1 FAD-dependent oxidoreductase [Methylobacterium platani JCM 14648]OAS19185.1 FAD-dependent oxidoreductase [Methylobacterium platani]